MGPGRTSGVSFAHSTNTSAGAGAAGSAAAAALAWLPARASAAAAGATWASALIFLSCLFFPNFQMTESVPGSRHYIRWSWLLVVALVCSSLALAVDIRKLGIKRSKSKS